MLTWRRDSRARISRQQNKKLQWMVEPHRPCSNQTPSRKGRGIMSQTESSPWALSSLKCKNNKNQDSNLRVQLFIMASNITGPAIPAIKYDPKGNFFPFYLFLSWDTYMEKSLISEVPSAPASKSWQFFCRHWGPDLAPSKVKGKILTV